MMNLVFQLTLLDPFGNKEILRVQRAQNRALEYRLIGGGASPISLNNLQMRDPLPVWHPRGEALSGILERIIRALNSGTRNVAAWATSPEEFDAECDQCGVALLDEEQIYCHACGGKL